MTLEIQQNLYDFGRTKSLINIADNTIFAQRAELREQEQEILLEASTIYLTLLSSIEINKLAKKREGKKRRGDKNDASRQSGPKVGPKVGPTWDPRWPPRGPRLHF